MVAGSRPVIWIKACAPRAASLTAFVISQVVIDVESGYHLFWGGWPLDREVHFLPVAGMVGLLAGVAVWFLGRLSSRNARIRAAYSGHRERSVRFIVNAAIGPS
jgi:hypothetical protein